MISQQRQDYILKIAQKNGFVSIPKTAKKLGVSVETVRRDINALCQKKQLKKVHGGAAPVKSPIWIDEKYSVRIQRNQQGKIAIAKEAAKMIRDRSIVSFDGGATTEVLASCIQNVQNVTFVVNSLPIAMTLQDKITAGEITGTVIVTGGQITVAGYRSYTFMAMDAMERYHYDLVFISCTAVSATDVSNSATNTSIYAKRLMQRASSSVLLADSEKLGKHSVCDFAKPTDFDRVIIDDRNPCPVDLAEALNASDTELTIVHCEP